MVFGGEWFSPAEPDEGGGLLVYCLAAANDEEVQKILSSQVHGLKGFEGADISLVSAGDLTAVASELANSAMVSRAGPDQILQYQQTIERLHRSVTVIPIRFGCFFKTPERLRAMLESCSADYRSLLLRLEGCVEMGVRLLFETGGPIKQNEGTPPPHVKAGGAGVRYLMTRKAHYSVAARVDPEAERVLNRYRAALSSLSVDEQISPPSESPKGMHKYTISINFLIRREDEARFREAFAALSGSTSTPIMLSGPWAPYHFC